MSAKLDVGKVVLGAFLVPWRNRRAFARALAVPLVLLVASSLLFRYEADRLRQVSTWLMWGLYVVYVLAFCWFAVTCHRLVLLDASRIAPQVSSREGRFVLWVVGVWFMCAAAVWMLVMLWLNLPGVEPSMSAMQWVYMTAQVPALYLFGRLSPVFPATAVDRRVSLHWAWRLTRGNGWRLVIVVGALPWIASLALSLLHRANASRMETVAVTVLATFLLAVEIAAISLSYRELTRSESAS